ncbi:S1 RNA-binding domain-containing protein 1-like [Dendronephthya gigantea]|uniref:S1 RNA-binding domain-containing protein 1-like n=1 Tax=Dendronephthya gigantea TaxID=151771 RepID=UPI00106BE015|nr:S1 RNA-binding domain-containing protein 1-like [Dendronephthya gigantea]
MSADKRSTTSSRNRNKNAINLITQEIIRFIADDVEVDFQKCESVIRLLSADNTVAFIARYRRHETGILDAQKIRLIQQSLETAKTIENRKQTVLKSIGTKLTPEIQQSLKQARSLQDVEDINAPFKPGSKGTLANRARELGLEKAAELIRSHSNIENLTSFVQLGKVGLSSNTEVNKGVQHIIADNISKDKETCDLLKRMFEGRHTTIETKVLVKCKKETKYKDYHERYLKLNEAKPHQILAINRAEKEKIIHVRFNFPENIEQRFIYEVERRNIFSTYGSSGFVRGMMTNSLMDAYNRLMIPKLTRQKRSELTKKAEREAVNVFSRNLRRLLLTPPIQGEVILAIDPGFQHGCKIAVVSEHGAVLDTAILDLLGSSTRLCEERLQGLLIQHNCHTIALGNGKGCRETENFITRMKKAGKLKKNVRYSIVGEDGASIYSVSKEAQKEMPNLDVNLRSAVSIARRLQNPMLELIKIEPKHLGVGMYQHDIPEQLLQQALNGVLEDCVSLVGVDLNASSIHALKRIAGLNERKAKEIIAWRDSNGPFRSREQLKLVKGVGEKTFEQCAGFVRIFHHSPEEIIPISKEDNCEPENKKMSGKRKAEGSGPSASKKRKHTPAQISLSILDSTSIHPESYATAKELLNLCNGSLSDIGKPRMNENIDRLIKNKGFPGLCSSLKCDPETLRLIVNGLCQGIGYDIRRDFSKPLFREGVMSIDDLRVNTRLSGRVTNVTTFGAFVDIGVGRDGLVHKSKLPLSGDLGAGDIVEVVCTDIDKTNNRISLRLI